MRWLVPLLVLAACTVRLTTPAVVGWREAAQCIGRFCTVRGRIALTSDEGPVIRLFFDAEQRDVYVTLVRGWLVSWPDYTGHEIAVTGPVDQFHGATEVLIDDPSDVVVLDAITAVPTPPSTPTATVVPTHVPSPLPTQVPTAPPTLMPTAAPTAMPAAPTATPAEEELQQLRQRVRQLEQRVRELEQEAPPGR